MNSTTHGAYFSEKPRKVFKSKAAPAMLWMTRYRQVSAIRPSTDRTSAALNSLRPISGMLRHEAVIFAGLRFCAHSMTRAFSNFKVVTRGIEFLSRNQDNAKPNS